MLKYQREHERQPFYIFEQIKTTLTNGIFIFEIKITPKRQYFNQEHQNPSEDRGLTPCVDFLASGLCPPAPPPLSHQSAVWLSG